MRTEFCEWYGRCRYPPKYEVAPGFDADPEDVFRVCGVHRRSAISRGYVEVRGSQGEPA